MQIRMFFVRQQYNDKSCLGCETAFLCKAEFVGMKKHKSFGRAFTKARGIQKGKALCRTPQSAKLFFLKKRRKGAKTVRCDCFCVGNPRRGFPVSSLMKQRTDVGIGPYKNYFSFNKRPRQIIVYLTVIVTGILVIYLCVRFVFTPVV